MQLEDYFEFEKHDTKFGPVERIRIKGHRISIENIIEPFNADVPAETIAQKYYPSLTLEQVYATITYYLHNRAKVDEYLRHGDAIAEKFYEEYMQQEPDPRIVRLRALKAEKLDQILQAHG
jgi:uncharacterized protein (DUF433 family)